MGYYRYQYYHQPLKHAGFFLMEVITQNISATFFSLMNYILVLASCKKDAVFINVGRGDVIDEASIVDAIQSKCIAGAILDVFAQEPLPASSKLWLE